MQQNIRKIIVAGSEGLIGKSLCNKLDENFDVVRLDLKLGHDLSDESQVRKIIAEHKDCRGLINLFCLNPQPAKKSENMFEISLDSLRQYLEINTVALFSICREFAKANPYNSTIINFSSIYGVRSPKHFIYNKKFTKHIGYTISKSSVVGLTKYLATYLAPNITVNCIVPGGVADNQDERFLELYSAMSPMKRMMKVEELHGAVEYFLRQDSSYTTGTIMDIDGGWGAW